MPMRMREGARGVNRPRRSRQGAAQIRTFERCLGEHEGEQGSTRGVPLLLNTSPPISIPASRISDSFITGPKVEVLRQFSCPGIRSALFADRRTSTRSSPRERVDRGVSDHEI